MNEAPRANGGRARWLNGQTLAVLCFIATTVTAVASVGAMTQAGLNTLRTDLGDQIKELRAEVRADIGEVREDLRELRRDMGKLDDRVRKVEIRLTAVDARVRNVEIQLTAIDARVQSVETRVQRVETQLTAVDARVQSVETRVQRVETQLAAEGRIAPAQTPPPAGSEADAGSIALPD